MQSVAFSEITYILLAGVAIAAAGGLLGAFALLRRMALVGDALSHVALPGIALALLFNFNLFFGAIAFLILGVMGIWLVEHRTRLPIDTVVGVFFAVSLAVGALLTPQEDILEALFGDIRTITSWEFALALILSLTIIFFLVFFRKKFSLVMISPDLTSSLGINPHVLEFFFLLIFGLAVAVGIKFAGALLMGSLIIIPAATARNLAGSMKSYLVLSAVLGIIGAGIGVVASFFYQLSPGPIFVIISGAFFVLSMVFRRK